MNKIALNWLKGFDSYVQEIMERWKVPGLSISIVKDGEVVLTEGYGYRDIQEKLNVTPNTVLPIASATKSFTALALGILADEGKLQWDKPVREYIPFFRMYDDTLSDKVTVRDILCHRTGLPRHEFSLLFTTSNRREIVEQIRYLQPSAGFRTTYQYQNRMYAAAGYLVEAVSGKTWEQFVQERIFGRLGMKDSNFSITDMQTVVNFSKPYGLKDGRVREENYLPIVAAGPAGCINSTAADMAKYMLMQAGRGKYRDEQIVSEASLKEMHTPYIPAVELPWEFEEIQYPFYGFGWTLEFYRGHKMIHHGGNTIGFTSLMTQLPEENLGVVILSNMNSSFLPMALTHNVLDRVLGLEPIDWTSRYQPEIDKLFSAYDTMKEETKKNRIADTQLSHNAEDYTGEYTHPAYGFIKVEYKDGGWTAKYNSTDAVFRHYHYDTFEIVLEAFDLSFLATYKTNQNGKIEGISISFEPSVDDIVFKKTVKEE